MSLLDNIHDLYELACIAVLTAQFAGMVVLIIITTKSIG